MSERFEWYHWLGLVAFIAYGVFILVTGQWYGRGNPNPTMARVGGGAILAIGLMGVAVGFGWLREGQD